MFDLKTFRTSVFLTFFLSMLGGCNTVLDVVKKDQIETNPNQRSYGAKLDDQSIETIVQHNIKRAHPSLDEAHIDVHSYNAVVLLTGEVPNEEVRSLAMKTAQEVANVRIVHNELAVRGNSSFMSRTNDSYIHTKIRFNLSRESALDDTDIDVVVQDSVAFLMGLVTEQQAETAAHVTSLTSGVRRVVKVFEYVD
ncbi:MAG: BON domain-containing protein [Pseudomonadales bacterium]